MLQSVLVLGGILDVDGGDEDGLNNGNVELAGLSYSATTGSTCPAGLSW